MIYFKLGVRDVEEPRASSTPRSHKPGTPRTPRTPTEFLAPPKQPEASRILRLDANAPIFIPSSWPHSFNDGSSDEDQMIMKPNIPALVDRRAANSGSERESPENDDPIDEYVRLKMRITNLTSRRLSGNKDAALLERLSARLDVVRQDYLFDEQDAEIRYRTEHERQNSLALQSRLRGLNSNDLTSEVVQTRNASKRRPPDIQRLAASDIPPTATNLLDDDADESDGLFEILDNLPESETNQDGVTIRIRDMALPKHWSGRTPKTLLAETIVKSDRYAIITYEIISGSSRAKRAAVSIRWEGCKNGEWRMEDVACHDETQAEAYVATLALHALTFPSTDGFQAGSSAIPGGQTFFRSLPAAFRDLWDELETSRKARDDAINRSVWANLRSIVELKLDSSSKVCLQTFEPPCDCQ